MSESTLERKCRQAAIDRGWEFLKWVSPGRRGVNDRIMLRAGAQVAFVEVKGANENPTKLQQFFHRTLRGMGFTCRTIDNFDDFIALLDELDNVNQKRSA